jgi:uncharacterized protein YceK
MLMDKCMKPVALSILILAMTGCGTINTVFRDDTVTSRNLGNSKSYCGSVPRVYSGVMYDFCTLHAPPANPDNYGKSGNMYWTLIDLTVSGVLDTLVLPYTIVRQNDEGSIEISHKK